MKQFSQFSTIGNAGQKGWYTGKRQLQIGVRIVVLNVNLIKDLDFGKLCESCGKCNGFKSVYMSKGDIFLNLAR